MTYLNTNLTLREFWKDHYNIVTCLNITDLSLLEVTRRTLSSTLKNLWPDAVAPIEFIGLYSRPEAEVEALQKIVSLRQSTGLEVDMGDFSEFVEEHEEKRLAE